jgi:hypothetical protein
VVASPPGEQAVVLGVVANPEPDDVGAVLNGERAVVQADADEPEAADALELQAGVTLVRLE